MVTPPLESVYHPVGPYPTWMDVNTTVPHTNQGPQGPFFSTFRAASAYRGSTPERVRDMGWDQECARLRRRAKHRYRSQRLITTTTGAMDWEGTKNHCSSSSGSDRSDWNHRSSR